MKRIDITDILRKNGSHGDKMVPIVNLESQTIDNVKENDMTATSGGSQSEGRKKTINLIEYPFPCWFGTALRVIK